MTSQKSSKVALDTALDTFFTEAGEKLGLEFNPIAATPNAGTTFEVKDAANDRLVGIVRLDPYSHYARSFAANSADNRCVSVVSVSLALQKPEDGQTPRLDGKDLHTLYKLSQHTLAVLANKKQQAEFAARAPALSLNA